MTPLNLQLLYVVEAGPIITLIGQDAETGTHTTVRIDQRPFEVVWRELRAAPEYVGYSAHDLSLSLVFGGAGLEHGRAL